MKDGTVMLKNRSSKEFGTIIISSFKLLFVILFFISLTILDYFIEEFLKE